jgi:hypothetical protein
MSAPAAAVADTRGDRPHTRSSRCCSGARPAALGGSARRSAQHENAGEQSECASVCHGAYLARDSNHVRMSPFSTAADARPRTSLQLRRNHLSTFAGFVNRSAWAAGASGAIGFAVVACRPGWRGSAVWHVAQLQSLCLALKSCSPRCAEKPAKLDVA